MRTALLLAALAALCATSLAHPWKPYWNRPHRTPTGPPNFKPGCHVRDTHKNYPIVGFTFRDTYAPKGRWIQQAWIQAKSRMRATVEREIPILKECDFDGIMPVKACYNNIEEIHGKTWKGQYGFVGNVQYLCPVTTLFWGYEEVHVPCKARLNTLRDNRLLKPSFWPNPATGELHTFDCAPEPSPRYTGP